jgi:type I restriction enzyme S subunit
VDFEFPDENGKPYKSSGGEMVYSDKLDIEIPILWTSVNLEELLEIKYGKDYKHLQNGEIPLYGSGGIMKYVNEALYDKESILIPRKGSLNNIIYINNPFWSVDTMFYSKSRREYFIKYLFHILNKIDFYNLDVGSAVPSMTTSILNNITVLKPIDNIVIQFDNYLVPIFKHIEILENETKSLFQIREVLLSKLANSDFYKRNDSYKD